MRFEARSLGGELVAEATTERALRRKAEAASQGHALAWVLADDGPECRVYNVVVQAEPVVDLTFWRPSLSLLCHRRLVGELYAGLAALAPGGWFLAHDEENHACTGSLVVLWRPGTLRLGCRHGPCGSAARSLATTSALREALECSGGSSEEVEVDGQVIKVRVFSRQPRTVLRGFVYMVPEMLLARRKALIRGVFTPDGRLSHPEARRGALRLVTA